MKKIRIKINFLLSTRKDTQDNKIKRVSISIGANEIEMVGASEKGLTRRGPV